MIVVVVVGVIVIVIVVVVVIMIVVVVVVVVVRALVGAGVRRHGGRGRCRCRLPIGLQQSQGQLPVLAVQAFCGLRVAEAARLRWSDILFNESGNYVQVGADVAKTSRRRLTPMPDGLSSHLGTIGKNEGHVFGPGRGSVDALQRAMMAFRKSLPMVAWGRNALRASALSYRLALTKDAAATAFETGNSASILTRFYAETAQLTVAKEWFEVRLDYSANL
jgi:hypothetical protein